MTNFASHIQELLFDHDCVILPGLGGFVSSNAPAFTNYGTNTFYPPHKNIIFNKNLISNDGLLVHKIANDQAVPYAEANKQLSDFIEICKIKLKNSRRIELENIGVLYLDNEENLQFIQDKNLNYSMEAFGLSAFKLKPLEQQIFEQPVVKEKIEKPEPVFEDRKPVAQPKTRTPLRKYAPALALIPVAALMIWLPFKMRDDSGHMNFAGLNPFEKKSEVIINYQPRTNTIAAKINAGIAKLEDTYKASIDSVKTAMLAIASADTTKVEPVSQQIIQQQTYSTFYVVAGCFANNENAQKMVEELKSRGFVSAAIIGENSQGLIRVAYSSHTSKEDAVLAMNKVKQTTQNVWVLKK